jgi:imidazolonepropionase-like amidohydrolase
MAFGRSLGFAAAALALLAVSCSPPAPTAPPGTKVLKDFTLIDGTGKAPVPNTSMIVDDKGRISWVGPTAELKAPNGAETTELAGKYVMPGLIDLHVHIAIVRGLKQDIANYTEANVKEDLTNFAKFGVTTVQVMGTDKDLIFPIRDAERAGRPTMARVYTAGQGIVFKGGYGGVVGLNVPVATPEEAVKAVDEQADKKVDIIKFWLDDELGTMPKMPPAMTKAIIDEAHKRGLKVVAHVFYYADAMQLIDQGIDGLMHSVRDKPVDQKFIDAMKAKGVWQIAETLTREQAMFLYGVNSETLEDPLFKQAVPAGDIEILKSAERQKTVQSNPHYKTDYPKFLVQAQSNLKTLSDAGVNIGMGTDSGPPGRWPGFSEHRELELMVAAGLTPMQALTAATGSAGKFLATSDTGVIEAGKWADLLVLNADPTADIKNVHNINSVYIAGNTVPSATQ